jgi:SAM-dependent methyltransferase
VKPLSRSIQLAFARALVAVGKLLPIATPAEPATYRASVTRRANTLYDRFYGRYAPFGGKVVAEIGVGAGHALAQYLDRGPRRYIAVDIEDRPGLVASLAAHPNGGLLEFRRSAPDRLPLADDSVDVVITENSFEHFSAYDAMIGEIHRVLRHGGVLATQFSPLYYSPYGAHLMDVVKFPWLHVMVAEDVLRDVAAAQALPPHAGYDHDYLWHQFATLNRLRPGEFLAPFRDGRRWRLEHVEAFPLAVSLRFAEPIRSLLTHGLRIVSRKAE